MATNAPSARPGVIAASVILGGAVLAFLGTMLDWYELSAGGESEAFTGIEMTAGAAIAGFSFVLLVCAILLFVRSRKGLGRGWAIAAIVVGAFMTFVAAYSAVAPEDSIVQFEASSVSEELGISESDAEEVLRQAIDQGQLAASSGPGTWISTIGSLGAVVGGILGVRAVPKQRYVAQQAAAYPPPPPPAP